MASGWYRETPGYAPPWLSAVAQLVVNKDRSRTFQRRSNPYSNPYGVGRGDTANAPCPDGFMETHSSMAVFADQLHVTCEPIRPDPSNRYRLGTGGCPKGYAPHDASLPSLVLSMNDWVNAPGQMLVSEAPPEFSGTQACFLDSANALPIGGRGQPPAQPAADKPTYVLKMSAPHSTVQWHAPQQDAVPPPPSGSPPWPGGAKPPPEGGGVAPWMIVAGGVALAGGAYWFWRKR